MMYLLYLILFVPVILCDDRSKLPPCAACDNLVKSFKAGFEKTSRGKFEGGDAEWEQKNQGAGYANSEVRFVEIQEEMCKDVKRGEQQCHSNHHEWEDKLEEWWKLEDRPGLRQWLCIDKLKVCCPEEHYGPDCTPCRVKDEKGQTCSGNGKCKGSGTRKGNGKCACNPGFAGEMCTQCASGYFQSYKEESSKTLLCSACHQSCLGSCSGPGAKACTACKSGYQMDTEHGCIDLDECAVSKPCTGNKFCVNTEGAYRCMKCDKACNGCEADGPDSCTQCAEGYAKSGDGVVCVSEQAANRVFTITNTRYFTYIGLCIAACIILQRSMWIAGALGVVIAVYISASEYYLYGATGELKPM